MPILRQYAVSVCPSGPEEGALSPSSSSHAEEQDMDMVTMTTASLSQQTKRGSGTGEGERRRRRERETKRKSGGGGLGPPDLDLDLVEEEVRGLERRQQEEEDEEERKRRSQTVRQKKRDDQKEQGRRSRSLPRSDARARASPLLEERVKESRRRGEERDNSTNRCAKHAGSSAASQKAAFSFLMPLDDDSSDRRLSDSESAASFSELSLSAASIATAGFRESDWRRDELGWQEGDTPGPWLKPSQQRLTQVLTGSRLRGRELVGGLSL